MVKRFYEGLVFGLGFAVSFVIIWVLCIYFVLPKMMPAYAISTKQPKFENPSTAEVREPEATTEEKEFSIFRNSHSRMVVPVGGGILSISPTATTGVAKRPSTYQLWLTESNLWQIRTGGEKVEIEELPYPKGASEEILEDLMAKNVGMGIPKSTMTVSSIEISLMKSKCESLMDESLNGQLKISGEGVVFFVPN